MNRRWATFGMILGILLAGPAMAFAAAGDTKLDPDSVFAQFKSIATLFIVGGVLAFLVIVVYTITHSLIDSRKNGGFGHVIAAVVSCLVAALAIWGILSLSGQDTSQISQKAKIDATK